MILAADASAEARFETTLRGGSRGPWLQTHLGIQFFPLDPDVSEVFVEDIAHALSNQCRYGGHCRDFYSVAQHSVLVARALAPEYQLWGLLHDGAEAYLVDVPRPIKGVLLEYKGIERGLMNCICARFGLDPEVPSEVKRVDNAILVDEARDLMREPPADWHLPEPALEISIDPWSPKVAKAAFLYAFNQLNSGEVLS